jgi:hypothetical protein
VFDSFIFLHFQSVETIPHPLDLLISFKVGYNDLPEAALSLEDEEFLKKLHHALLNVSVILSLLILSDQSG